MILPRFHAAHGFAQGRAAVDLGTKRGFIDTTGALVFEAPWSDPPAPTFADGRALVWIGDKWGYIDRNGRVVIQPAFRVATNFSEQLAAVFVGQKYGYIDTTGAMTIAPQLYFVLPFSEGLAPVKTDEHTWGYIDRSGRMVIEPRPYLSAAAFEGGLAQVQDRNGFRYIDRTGNTVWPESLRVTSVAVPADTSRRLLVVSQQGRFGYIDTAGRIVIPLQFDLASPFHSGLALVRTANKWGFIDPTGRAVIPPQFDAAHTFAEGLAAVQVGSQWGYIDRTGRMVIRPQFDEAGWFSEGLSQAKIADKWGFIDTTGALVIQPQFEFTVVGSQVSGFSGGRAWMRVPGRGYVLIDPAGKVMSGPYDDVGVFFTGFTTVGKSGNRFEILAVPRGAAPVRIGDKWGLIDTTGAVIVEPRFDAMPASGFSEGRASVCIGEKLGYIDTTGAVVIEPRFEETHQFSEGLAAIKLNGKWGYIDVAGRVVIAPRFGEQSGRRPQPSAQSFSDGLAAVRIGDQWGYIDRNGQVVVPAQFDRAFAFDSGVAQVELQVQGEIQKGYINRAGRWLWDPRQATLAQQQAEQQPDTSLLEGTGSLVDRVAALVERLEAAEAGRQQLDVSLRQLGPRLNTVATRLTGYLEANPNDVRALILSVRLGRFQQVAQPLVIQGGDAVPTFRSLAAEYAPHHAALNRALALEPNNAEVHYWKARLYGLSHDWMGMLYGVTAPPATEQALARAYADSAVRFGRRAVELAPDRIPYREALAIYLILNEQGTEAATVLRDVAGGHHPMSTLLADWEAIPVPARAVPLPAMARGVARSWMEDGAISDYPFLRVRMYVVPLPADSLQAFYGRHWPGFRFFLDEDQEDAAPGTRNYMQLLQWRNGQVVAARDKGQIPDEPTGGVLIALIEVANPPPEVRRQFPVPLGKIFCSLSFINLRRVAAP